jgi:DNA-binding HxlR family transcriptional regulator
MSARATSRRSVCPTCYALDIFGDKWTLLIVRDLMFKRKTRYGEFLNSDERIATNILADRLDKLLTCGVIEKRPDPTNSRASVFALTQKGRDLLPLMIEITLWSAKYDPDSDAPAILIRRAKSDRKALLRDLMASFKRAA